MFVKAMTGRSECPMFASSATIVNGIADIVMLVMHAMRAVTNDQNAAPRSRAPDPARLQRLTSTPSRQIAIAPIGAMKSGA